MGSRSRLDPHPAARLDRQHPPRAPKGAPARRASDAILALQRSAGNQAVAALMREPGDGAAPLLLTDRPWSEIERERRDRMWGGILPGTRLPPSGLPDVGEEMLKSMLIKPPEGEEADEVEQPEPAPTGQPLMLSNRPYNWKKHDHDVRVHEAQKAQERRARDRASEIAVQQAQPRKAGPRIAEDWEATARIGADTARDSAVRARETALANQKVMAAHARMATLDADVSGLVALVQPPDAVTASFMSAAEVNQVAADLALAQAQLAAIRAHAAALAASLAHLAAPPVSQAILAQAYVAASTPFDITALSAQVRATRRTHLTPAAVSRKVQLMLDEAKADPTKLLGHAATVTIHKAHAGKARTTIAAEIAAAVGRQHNPALKTWLELLQVTTSSAKDGQLRIKLLPSSVSPSAGAPGIPVHLSVYLNSVGVPASGVNATVEEVLDAVLPLHRHTGAHLTLEYKGQIAPKQNPHYFRGDATAIPNDYPQDSTWTTVEDELMRLMNVVIAELRIRIQTFLDRKGRDIGDN